MNWVWWDFSYFVVFFSWLVNVPQALRIIKKKDASQVAVMTYLLLAVVIFTYWIHALRQFYYYGDWVFVLSNSLSMLITIWVLFLIRKYTKNFTYFNFFKIKIKKWLNFCLK
jgi:uncharacterized protein with PQ loop repeat